jgi:hypothetical protein
LLLLLVAGLLAPSPAAGERILHEYVPPPDRRSPPLDPQRPPEGVSSDGQYLPRPRDGARPAPGEPTYSQRGHSRPPRVRLDRTTTHDGVLNYTAEFNPSVVPFKRVAAFDQVGPGYALEVADAALRPVPVAGGSTPPDRTAFWGSVMLRFASDRPVPLPSVAPGARILSTSTTPRARLAFYRDSADNIWVRSPFRGRLRLVFLTDAPRSYFSAQIPRDARASQVDPRMRPRLPPQVQRAAARVLRRLRVRRGDPMQAQLSRMVAYFRSFKAGVLPRVTGDAYLDIALSQRGVCRHRSLAFVVTAQALGIPARYVQNEAHAFSEVFVPRVGWIRVDLGGASRELRVHNAQRRVIHEPGPDPFPRPTRYAASYSQFGSRSRISGLSREQRLRGGGQRRVLRVLRGGQQPSAGAGAPAPARAVRGRPAPPPRLPLTVTLRSPTRVVHRGQPIQVAGRVTHGDRGVAGLLVEIHLSRDGRLGRRVGTIQSGKEGRFEARLPVPRDVAVGRYRIFAYTPGSQRYSGAISQ